MDFDRVPKIAKYLSVTFLLTAIGRYTVWSFLPIYLERHIASVFLVGIITSLPAAVPVLMDVPTGNLVQRAGEKIVIFMGLVSAIIPPLMYYTAVPALLVLAKMFEGVSKVFLWNGSWSLSLKSADDDAESESVSVFLLGINLAAIIGPIIGGFLLYSYGFELTFLIWTFTASLAVLAFATFIGLDRKQGLKKSLEELLERKTYAEDWHHLRDNWDQLRFPFCVVFLYSIIFSFYWLAIPLLLDKVGADFQTMGIVLGVAALPKAFQVVFGDMADRIGRRRMLVILSVLLTPVLVSMSFISNVVVLGALFFIARALSAGMSPAIHAIFDERTPDHLEGEMTGVFELSKHSGQSLGPVIAGTVASIWTINASYLAAAGIAALVFATSYLRKLD